MLTLIGIAALAFLAYRYRAQIQAFLKPYETEFKDGGDEE